MGGLDDLNTESPLVRRALRDSYGYWIREVGVDGFRVDTAFYVPPDYFDDFLYADDPAAPGVDRVARSTGREALSSTSAKASPSTRRTSTRRRARSTATCAAPTADRACRA